MPYEPPLHRGCDTLFFERSPWSNLGRLSETYADQIYRHCQRTPSTSRKQSHSKAKRAWPWEVSVTAQSTEKLRRVSALRLVEGGLSALGYGVSKGRL